VKNSTILTISTKIGKEVTIGASFHASTLSILLFFTSSSLPGQVKVRITEGSKHGFLTLRDMDNKILASGDLIQVASGTRVTSDVAFQFKDGSIHQETTVFSQRGVFRLLTYHLVQKGPSFKRSIDMKIDCSTGQVTVSTASPGGKEQTISDHLNLPSDLANGLIYTLLNDLDPKAPATTVSMVVAMPKPRIVKVEISPDGEDSFSIGGAARKAIRYVAKIHIGGVAGVVAPIIGKDPPATHIWMAGGKAPVVLKSEGILYEDGPIWRTELAAPVW
jgi:hypothetical protein